MLEKIGPKPYVPEGSFGDVSFPSTSQYTSPSLLNIFLHHGVVMVKMVGGVYLTCFGWYDIWGKVFPAYGSGIRCWILGGLSGMPEAGP